MQGRLAQRGRRTVEGGGQGDACPASGDPLELRRTLGRCDGQQRRGEAEVHEDASGAGRRALHPVPQAAVLAEGEPFEGECAAGAVAAQLPERLPVVLVNMRVS